MAVTVTATPDPSYARMQVDVTFTNTAITAAKVERRRATQAWQTLAGGAAMALSGGVGMIFDYEVPLDVPVEYRATQVTPAGSETGMTAAMVTVDGRGHTWLRDPVYPSRSLRLDEVTGLTELNRVARAGVFPIIDRARPVVVAARRQSWTGELQFTTATTSQRSTLYDMLSRGQVLFLNVPKDAEWGIGAVYVHVGDVVETRISPLVSESSRAWTLPLTEVDRPQGIDSMPLGVRWVDVKARYATWGDLAATGMTWNQLLEGGGVT